MTTIKINKESTKNQLRNYYYEVMTVYSKRKNINPDTVFQYHYNSMKLLFMIYGIYMIIITYLVFFYQKSVLTIFFYCLFLIFFIYILWGFIRIEWMIKEGNKTKGKRVITIDKEGITATVSGLNQSLSTKWDSIDYLLIGPNTLIFLPKNKEIIPISLSIIYKDEVLEGLKKEKVEIKIIEKK